LFLVFSFLFFAVKDACSRFLFGSSISLPNLNSLVPGRVRILEYHHGRRRSLEYILGMSEHKLHLLCLQSPEAQTSAYFAIHTASSVSKVCSLSCPRVTSITLRKEVVTFKWFNSAACVEIKSSISLVSPIPIISSLSLNSGASGTCRRNTLRMSSSASSPHRSH